MKPSFFYPVKPWVINQAWGILNPIYQQFGFSRHNGVDVREGTDKFVYAPCDGTIIRTGNQPTGGGIFVGLLSAEYTWPDGKKAHALFDFLHCEKLLVSEGQVIKTGDKLAISDNTGFSTGPHIHIQTRRVTKDLLNIDINDANNSFDPTPYWNKMHASDSNAIITQMTLLVSLLQKLLAIRK